MVEKSPEEISDEKRQLLQDMRELREHATEMEHATEIQFQPEILASR